MLCAAWKCSRAQEPPKAGKYCTTNKETDTVQSQHCDMDSFVHAITSGAFRLYRLKYLQHMHECYTRRMTWHFGDEPFQAVDRTVLLTNSQQPGENTQKHPIQCNMQTGCS